MLSEFLSKLGLDGRHFKRPESLHQSPARELIAAYQREALISTDYQTAFQMKDYASGRAILGSSPGLQAEIVAVAIEQLYATRSSFGITSVYNTRYLLRSLAMELVRRKPQFDESQICAMIEAASDYYSRGWMPMGSCVAAAERFVAERGMSERTKDAFEEAAKQLSYKEVTATNRRLGSRLKALAAGAEKSTVVELTNVERWSAAILEFVAGLDVERRQVWSQLLAYAASATASKPSARWLKAARAHVDRIGAGEFRARFLEWAAIVEKGGRNVRPLGAPVHPMTDEHFIMDPANTPTLKGLVWTATVLGDDSDVAQQIGRLAVSAYHKIPWLGARSTALGNACVWALGAIPGTEAVGQLAFVRMKSKYRAAQQGIQKSLHAAAEREGVSAEDLEELATPTCGLTEVGRRVEPLGEFVAELLVKDTRTIELDWKTAAGKPQKTVPAAVKRDFADRLKELKAAQKNLQKLVPAQRARIESFYLSGKRSNYAAWRERYLDHSLVGTIARRLIWKIVDTDGVARAVIWHKGELVDADGEAIAELAPDAVVELWHPVGATVEQVVAWRDWLERQQITQPFKQAHREIYLLTDAERRTDTYSNRFAAHILKQHQFAALCHERGWRYTLQGAFDSSNTPTIDLPQPGLRVEYWVEPVDSDERTEMSIYMYLSTDQVRFYGLHEDGPMRLEDVPPLVFSEIMRDVDLFVGVSSVGNDPHWIDGGADARHYMYWQSYSFGELTESSSTRRDVLQRLLPRLKIADRCRIEDKFLIVRGDIRSYKVHLGSGNILMMPNDSYLCIVPGQGSGVTKDGKMYLPFEGDRILSIILSKAIMLANDTKITDRSIVSQIRV